MPPRSPHPVLVGGGQWSNRVDRGEPTGRAGRPDGRGAAAGRRRQPAPPTPTLLARRRHGRVVSTPLVALPRPGLAGRRALGADAARPTWSPDGGQLAAGARQPGRASTSRRRRRPRADLRRPRRGAPACGTAPATTLDWTVQADDVARGPRTLGRELADDPRRPSWRAGVVHARAGVPAVREALRARPAGAHRRAPRATCPSCGPGSATVAAGNPHAWIQQAYTAEEIRTPAPDNRMVGWPYTKLMNSNNAVEQGAALILCSAERAEALGVPRDRWVFPLAGTDAHDTSARVAPRPTCGRPRRSALAGRAPFAPGRRRRRRPRPRRPLLVLPVGGAGRGGRARARHSTGRSP